MTTQVVEIDGITLRLKGNKVVNCRRTFNGTIAITRDTAVFVESDPIEKRSAKPARLYDGKFVTATCSPKGECRVNLRSINIEDFRPRTAKIVACEIEAAVNAIKDLKNED